MGENERSDRMSELIGRSSLGTDEARAIRSYTSASDVAEVLKTAERLRARGRPRPFTPETGMARRFSAPDGRRPPAAARSGARSATRTVLRLLAGIGVVTSTLLLVTGTWHLRAVAVWAATAVLVSAGRRVT